MKFFYTDAKKQKLQKLEILVAVFLLPIGLYFGGQAYRKWSNFKASQALVEQAVVFEAARRVDDSVRALEEAVKLCPEHITAWEMLAIGHHLRGNYRAANETYIRAVGANPHDGDLRRELATSYHNIGKHDEEAQAATEALSLTCSDPVFTQSVYERAQKEQSGEFPKERIILDKHSFLRLVDFDLAWPVSEARHRHDIAR